MNYWKYAVPGIFLNGVCFAIWDYYFTVNHIWFFNDQFIIGSRIFLMPLEEYFFFIVTPFACLFIYEAVSIYYQPLKLKHYSKILAVTIAVLCLVVAVSNSDRTYTFVNFTLGFLILVAAVIFLNGLILSRFWLAFLIHLIPFYLVNGVLTSAPVLIYNNTENLNLRVFTIPVEDHVYSLILFLSNLWAYEWFKKKYHSNGL